MRLRRVVSAVDTGIAVNPDTIIAQLQGGLVFGLSAALWGEITIDKGRVQQSNFHDYRMLRMDEECRASKSTSSPERRRSPGGIGETGTTAGPPAPGQRDLRRNRRAPAPVADRSRRARHEEADMKKRPSIVEGVWARSSQSSPCSRILRARVLRNASRCVRVRGRQARLARRVPDGHPTGVPADLTSRSIRSRVAALSHRSRRLPKSCHTAEGGKPFAGGRAFEASVRHAVYAEHPAGPADRHRRMDRCRFPQGRASGHRSRRRASVSPRFPRLRVVCVHDRRGRARDQRHISSRCPRSATLRRPTISSSRSTSAG